jgi:hypothetical protein
LAALCLGLLFALGIGELASRVLVPTYAPIAFDVYRKDARGQLRLQPLARRQHASPEWSVRIETNAAGFRDTEAPPRPGQPVVIVLGDSMAFGWGVEAAAAFPARLEVTLRPEDARVLNAAIPGTGPTDQLALLPELLERTRADVVVLAFFVGNDFDDVASGGAAQYDIVDGLLVLRGQPHGAVRRLSAWLKRKSRLAQLVAERLWLLEMRRNEDVPVERREHPALGRQDAFLRRFVQIHGREPLPPRLENGVAETLAALESMRQLANSRGARFVLAAIPRSIQVYDADRRRYEQAFGVRPEDWDMDRPQRILREWATGRDGVELVDLLPVFRNAAPSSPRFYFFPDSHMTTAGHAVTAADLARQLRSRQLRR